MPRYRIAFPTILVLAVCLMAACDHDSKEQAAGGAFLKANSGNPGVLWKAQPPPPPVQPRLDSLLHDGQQVAFLELGARAALGGALERGDRVDFLFDTDFPEYHNPLAVIEEAHHDGPDEASAAGSSDGAPSDSAPKPAPPPEPHVYAAARVLQNVRVLRSSASCAGCKTFTLAVAVTPREAQLLRLAQASGRVAVLARHPADTAIGPPLETSLSAAVKSLDVFAQRRAARMTKAAPNEQRFRRKRLTKRLRRGLRAMAVPMKLSRAVASQLHPGARVDVTATIPLDDRNEVVATHQAAPPNHVDLMLLQDVRVLAVRGVSAATRGKKQAPAAPGEPVVVVEVSVHEAALLAMLARRATLGLTLRARSDSSHTADIALTGRRLLEDLQVIDRERVVRLHKRRPPKKDGSIKIYHDHAKHHRVARKDHGLIKLWGTKDAHASPKADSVAKPQAAKAAPATASAAASAKPKPGPAPAQPAASAASPPATAPPKAPTTGVLATKYAPRSSFAIDVDTASYTLARRYLADGTLPPSDSVRVEEFINYFDYDNPWPDKQPFAITVEGAPSPFWRSNRHYLIRVGVQARKTGKAMHKPVNLTFLIDTSSSMRGGDRLGMVKKALIELTKRLRPEDSVAIVGYGDGAHEILGRVGGDKKPAIAQAIKGIVGRGATDMQAGMRWAYRLARPRAGSHAENRVIILSDGNPNVGADTARALLATVAKERDEGVTLSTIGFGHGKTHGKLMEQLADHGDGNSFYVDSVDEAKRLFGKRMLSTVLTVARDVKAQVEFDPKVVTRYRRIGYDDRALTEAQWQDSSTDAGEIGAGHRVTVLYEVELAEDAGGGALGTVRLRYKEPEGDKDLQISAKIERKTLHDSFASASDDLRFAASVAGFAEVLAESPLGQYLSLDSIAQTARAAAGDDPQRKAFVALVERARKLQAGQKLARGEQASPQWNDY